MNRTILKSAKLSSTHLADELGRLLSITEIYADVRFYHYYMRLAVLRTLMQYFSENS